MKLIVPHDVLEEVGRFLESAGSLGLEGTGALAAVPNEGADVATKFIAPDQVGEGGPGCSVAVTEKGKLELVAALAPNERYVARVHSHPGAAFHSSVDDRNPFLTAEGAWSIVVPYFGLGLRRGIAACAVYRYSAGRWQSLTAREMEREIEVFE